MSKEIIPPSTRLHEATYNALIGLWMENFARNMPLIRGGLDLQDLPKHKDEPCILIAAGPSLARYRHLAKIRKSGWKHPVLSCDRVFQNCLKHDIIPSIVASIDGSPLIAKYYKHKIVRKYTNRVKAAFSVTVHPNTVKAWKGELYWFVVMLDNPDVLKRRSISFILHLLSKGKALISGVGNVGSFLWNLSAEWECSPIILVGYDFSEQVKYKEQAVYWNALVNMFLRDTRDLEKAMDKAAALHQVERNPDFDRYYLVNPIWKSYREMLKAHIVTSKIHTINCSENGCLHTEAIKCKNFEAMPLKQALRIYN